jgi:hypothetical protein
MHVLGDLAMPRRAARLDGLALVMFFVVCASVKAVSQPIEYRILQKDLACIRENAEKYRASGQDPLFVSVRDCPQVVANAFSRGLVAEGPRIRTNENASDSFIFLTKGQFDCLVAAEVPKGATLLRFLPDSCRLEVTR